MLTVVQDPFGLMETASRKLKAGFLGYYGRWGLPVPRRVPCTVVVAPHVCGEKTASPTAEELEVLHKEYQVFVRKRRPVTTVRASP